MSCCEDAITATNGHVVKNDDDKVWSAPTRITRVDNYIGDKFVRPQRLVQESSPVGGGTDDDNGCSCYMDIHNPATSQVIGKVCLSDAHDVEAAVEAASMAFGTWSQWTIKARAVRDTRRPKECTSNEE